MAIINILKTSPLFQGINEDDLHILLKCLSVSKSSFDKSDFIFMEGDNVQSIGIMLSGSVHIIQEDFWGNRTILAKIEPPGLFGEAFSGAGVEKIPVSVIASDASEIIFADYRKIITTCSDACIFHMRLIKNMMSILSNKNIMLMQKIEVLAKRSTREKLLSYLSSQAQRNKSSSFSIPFNRQELADYLCADRSALSRELGLMQNEGLIKYNKNIFTLFDIY